MSKRIEKRALDKAEAKNFTPDQLSRVLVSNADCYTIDTISNRPTLTSHTIGKCCYCGQEIGKPHLKNCVRVETKVKATIILNVEGYMHCTDSKEAELRIKACPEYYFRRLISTTSRNDLGVQIMHLELLNQQKSNPTYESEEFEWLEDTWRFSLKGE